MVYEHTINGLPVKSGDLICTTDGGGELLAGQYWRLIGKLIPGDVDHIAIYIGPEGRCVESGATGRVIEFEFTAMNWDGDAMFPQRQFIDIFYGVAYPLAGKGFSQVDEYQMREKVSRYCMDQAKQAKPYNINFLNSETEDAFYCSQLAYKAYLPLGIDLNTDAKMSGIPGTNKIIFPQEIWNNCVNKRA